MRHLLILGILLQISAGLSLAQANDKNFAAADIPQAFRQLPISYERLSFVNSDFDVHTRGGHLQGVQYYQHDGIEYVVLSGSSDKVAYYAMVDINKKKLIRYHEIGVSPYDHAGGFQIVGDFLVIGVEDNTGKDASKIVFYDLSKPGQSDLQPIHTIHRGKEFKSKTAGALAITQYKGGHLMAVASWDAATIDFYISNGKAISDSTFGMQLINTWRPDTNSKKGWSDLSWNNYQGLSLLADTDDKLYVFGFARNGFRSVADCFEVLESNGNFSLLKVNSRCFKTGKNSFRYGTGMYVSSEGKLYLYSTPYQLRKKNTVNRYGS